MDSSKVAKSGAKETAEEMADKALLKAQRKAQFELQMKDKLKTTSKDMDTKSKSELKAERRAKQEMQRMAKQSNDPKSGQKENLNINKNLTENNGKQSVKSVESDVKNDNKNTETLKPKDMNAVESRVTEAKKVSSQAVTTSSTANTSLVKRGQIFAHIPKRIKDLNQLSDGFNAKDSLIHPMVIQTGFQMNKNLIDRRLYDSSIEGIDPRFGVFDR
ncbi:unnamed protein product [Medioppia subpectinata]|uniref:Uncharacterized protein n=1 Tax=Medioppia subpectinata TaxID=1979941 RepID=A0A7R9Q534_9ACAR|nr:unnamed protein product [Medioppia subpectinata]CAG2112337.1 unnamed protein product [Medioppia subpectinata]